MTYSMKRFAVAIRHRIGKRYLAANRSGAMAPVPDHGQSGNCTAHTFFGSSVCPSGCKLEIRGFMPEIHRRKTVTATIGTRTGQVRVGSDAPVVVQSMTNTDTADIPGTIEQVAALARAGSELVRVTVNNDDAAKAVPYIVEGLDRLGI